MAKPSRRFSRTVKMHHTNLRDVVHAGVVARVEDLGGEDGSVHAAPRQRTTGQVSRGCPLMGFEEQKR